MVMFIAFMIAGISCGVMLNIALDNKFYDKSGVLGGIIVGILMFLL